MGSIEIEFCPFMSVATIATGACKETIFSDSADLRAESPGSAASWGLIQDCPAGPTLVSPRSILHAL